MFIRSKPYGTRQRVQIIENIREGDKVRQHIVRHVGVAHDEGEVAQLKQYAETLIIKIKAERAKASGQGNLFAEGALPAGLAQRGRPKRKDIKDILPVDKVVLDDLKEIDRIVEGVHDIGGHVYEEICGFDTLLAGKRDRNILRDIVLGRMVAPDSKRGLQKLLAGQFDKDHDLDAIYGL